MNIVIDTNVLVSGLLKPFSAPGEIVRVIAAGDIVLCVDGRLLAEYAEVLKRPKFRLDADMVVDVLDSIRREGILVSGDPLEVDLPDDDDRPFIEVALAGNAQCLVTGNAKHFPLDACRGIKVMTPRQFVDHYRSQTTSP